jgi:hypothetical protein
MATDREEPQERLKPFENNEFRKGNIAAYSDVPSPSEDPDFRTPSLDAGTILDRRKFEANLRRYKLLTEGDVITIINNYFASAAAPTVVCESTDIPKDGIFYEMLTCDNGVLAWGWGGTGNTLLGLEANAGGNLDGGYDTYIGYRAGYHSTTSAANVVVGAGSGLFLRTSYTIDPDVTYSFTLRRSSAFSCPQRVFKFGDYLITSEYNTSPAETNFYKSLDGINWSSAFTISGSSGVFYGHCGVEFLNKLYISWYDQSPDPIIYVWDGNTVTTTLTSVTQNNQLAGPMISYGSKLWVLTDVTPLQINDRRVVHWSTDGAAWTPVTDYGGDAYLDYNRNNYHPTVGTYLGRYLCNRWLEWNGSLYLFASVWNTANANWSWQIWLAGASAFTLVYDSSEFDDNCALSSVVTNGEFIIATGNTLDGGGGYEDSCCVYRSTNITAWSKVFTKATQGLCYESLEYGNIFYSMFVIQAGTDYYTKLYYWDDANSLYVQCDNSITTNDHYISGNFIEYKGSFFVGKWMELYELTRTKSVTITITSKEASGNTIVGATAGDQPITGNLNCLFGYNTNLSSPEVSNSVAIGSYANVSRDNTIVLGATGATYQHDVVIGKTYAQGRLDVYQYGEKETDNYGLYLSNVSTNSAFDAIKKYGIYINSSGAFLGLAGTGTTNYGLYVDAATGADTNYGIYSVDNIKTEDQFISSLAIGTKPIDVTSTTLCNNLNADLLDGSEATAFAAANHSLLSATHGDTTAGTVVLGDIVYGDATPKWVRLAGQTAAAKKYLSQTGTGSASAAPAWAAIAQADVTGMTTADGPSFDHLHLTIATGTAPMVVASETEVANLNAHLLQGNHASAFEPALGNPGTTGWVLSSTDAGVRSWVAAGGALALDDLTDVDAASPSDHDIIQYHTGSGWVHGSLPAGANHDILSATHGDSTAAAVVAGAIIIGDDTPKWIRLLHGNEGDVLTVASGLPSWAAPGGAAHNVLSVTHTDTLADTVIRGDILYGNATPKWARLAKGTEGYVLTMGANEPSWAAPAASGAPTGAKYIVQEAHADLAAEQSLGALATGIVYNTTTAGVGVLTTFGFTISDNAPSGGSNGDVWLEY